MCLKKLQCFISCSVQFSLMLTVGRPSDQNNFKIVKDQTENCKWGLAFDRTKFCHLRCIWESEDVCYFTLIWGCVRLENVGSEWWL